MKLSLKSYFPFLSCLMLVSLGLASCGGPAPTTAANSTNMTLKVAVVVNKSISYFPFYVAQQENFIKGQGLTLNPATVPALGSGANLALAVESNSIDVAIGAITDVFTISRVDSQIRIIGAVTSDFLLDVVVSKKFEAEMHITATSSLADKVKALAGKKVGISAPNSATDALLTYLFRQQGLNAQKDVVKVNLGAAVAPDLAALKANRVDAIVVTAPGGELAQVQGIGDLFISPTRGDVPSMLGQLFGVAYTKQSTINAKPQAVRALIRAIAQADTFIQKNPAKATVLLGNFLKLNQQTLNLSWNQTKASMPDTPQVNQQSYNTANQFHVQAGLIAVALPYNDLVANDTISKAISGLPGA